MMKFTEKMIFQMIFSIVLFTIPFGVYAHSHSSNEFVHGITIKLHNENYYFAGPPDGANGESDVPGHKWLHIRKHHLLGQQFNTGPFGAPSFYSSDAGDGALLYTMEAVIDEWTEAKALQYFSNGYIQYHALVNAKTGQLHPTKVAWFKHVAVKTFELDGAGPLAFLGIIAYTVMPGVDYKFGPNWDIPYNPNP